MNEQMGTDVKSAPETAPVVDGNQTPEVKPEASTTPAWMAQLPNDLKGNDSLKQYSTLGDAIKNLMEGKKETPAEEPKKEKVQYKDFNKKFETADDPFGDISKGLSTYMEGKGIPQSEAEEFFDAFMGTLKSAKENMIKNGREYCEKAVKEKWGDQYETKRSLMARGFRALGDTDGSLQAEMDRSGVSLLPATWELLSRVGALVSEDSGSPVRGTGGAPTGYPGGVPVDYSKPSV